MKVLLFSPPFYRFMGSHNDKIPLSLCYLSQILTNNNIENQVYNGDFTGSNSYWSIKHLFNNFDDFKDAVDNKGPLYGEIIEKIVDINPDIIIISGADSLISTKDNGSPFIGKNFSQRLRELGFYTVGFGPYYSLDYDKFKHDFDCILQGEPSEQILDIVKNKPQGLISPKPMPLGIKPNLDNLYPSNQRTDAVLTSLGCLYPCSFCIAGKQYRDFFNTSIPASIYNAINVANLRPRPSSS